MKKIPSFSAFFMSILMVLFAVSATWADAVSLAEDGDDGTLYVNLPTTGTNTLEIGTGVTSFKVYDDGGKDDIYTLSASLDGSLVMTAPEGYVLQVEGTVTTHYYYNASMTIYDGDASAEPLVSSFGSQSMGVARTLPAQTSSGRMMTIRFRNGAINYSYEGLDLTVTLKDASIAHEITFENQGQGGTISTTNTDVLAGETVSLNIQPASGYLMSGVSLTGENGKSLKFTGGEWYTGEPLVFTMPYADVTVTPTYTDNLTDAGGLYINMPATGTTNAQIPGNVQSFKVYDDGGRTGSHKAGADGYLVLTAPEGYVFRLSGTIQSADASLSVYDGAAYASNLKKMIEPDNGYSDTDVGDVFGSSRIMTLYFKSNGYSYSGFDLTLSLGEYVDYAIATASSVGNGSVEIAENAKPGDVVSLTANPQDGNVFSGVRVVDENGNVVETTKDGNTATFVMPFAEVTVTPYFAGSTVSYDNAGCLDNGMYFRVECSSQTCTISQGAFVPGDDDYRCWSELAAKVEEELGRNWSTIMLGSNLYLGGYDSVSDACVLPNFSALYTRSFDGNNHTVYGFCHITADSSGFLQADVNSISSVAFVDAYVRGDSAGVLGASLNGEITWNNVSIDSATIIGNTVGALAGHLDATTYGYSSTLSNVTITNSAVIATEVAAADSVQAGVVAGKGCLSGHGASVIISNNTVSADASIAGTTIVSLGGVLGVMVNGRNDLPNTYRLSNVSINNASSAAEVNIGGFAGLLVEGYSVESLTLAKFGFEGTIVNGTNVGGILGKVNLPNTAFVLKNTYSRGAIDGSGMIGYIVGSLNVFSNAIYNNYHVGSDVVVLGIGNGYNTDTWKTGSVDVFGNVRNASGTLATDGDMGHYMHGDDMYYYLDYFAYSTEQEGGGEDPVVVRLVGVVRNGIADGDDMKTDMFAALMNKNPVVQDGETPNADEHNVWTRADGLNDNFPTFADDEHLPNHVVSIDWDGSWGLNSTQMSTLGFERWNAYFFDDDYGYYQAIYGYTDATQHVSSGLVNKLNALVSAVEMSSGAEAGSLLLIDGNGLDVTSTANATFSSDQSLTIKGVQNISVVYNYCTEQTLCTPFESQTDKTFIFMSPKVNTISSADDGSYQLLPLVVDLGGTDEVPDATQLRLSVKLYDENDEEIELPASWTYHSQIWLVSEISQFIRGLDNTVSKIELNYQSGSSENLDVYVSNGPTIDAYGVDADGESVRVFSSSNTNYYVTIPSAMGVRAYDFEQKVGYELEGTYTATYEYYDGTYELDEVHEPIYESTEDHAFGSVANLLQKMVSNVRVHWSVGNLTATDTVNLNNVKTALALAKQEVSTDYGPSGNLRVAANYTPINYTVNFNLKLPAEITDNSVLFFGNGWNNPKSNVTVEAGNLPKVYTTTCPAFGGWSPVDDGSVPGTYVLNESFLTSAVVDADYNTTAYGTWVSDNCTTPHTLDFSYWAQHEGEDMGLPGSVILKQVLSATDTIAHPMVTTYDGDGYASHYTTLPEVDDTLTFIVSTAIERGFKISGIELQRTFKTGVNENTSIVLNAPEQGDTTLTINTSMLNSAGFNISFDYERFLVGFKRPTDNAAVGVADVDYYVADEYAGEDWHDEKNYGLGDANLDMPKLYALDGCIGWSKATTYDGEHPVYRQFDQSVAQDYESEMVLYPVYFTPTDNPNLCGDAPTDVFLIETNVNIPEGLDHLELLQIIGVEGDGAHPDTIKHVMTQDDQDPTLFTLQVPKVSLSQAVAETFVPFTFEIHAVPVEGYSTYSGSYYKEMTQEGNGTLKVVIDDGILTTNGHYESFKVDLIGNLSYPLAFDTENWDSIAYRMGNSNLEFRSELYVADGDFDLPESYELGETALKLPMLYAATLENDQSGMTNTNKSFAIAGWTIYADSAYCVVGAKKNEEANCIGMNSRNLFTEFSGDMVAAIQEAIARGAENGGITIEDDSIHLYPVWNSSTENVTSIYVGCSSDAEDCGSNDHPMVVTLSQNVRIAGKDIALKHSSDYAIAFPQQRTSIADFTLDVSFTSNPGYDVSSIKLEETSEAWAERATLAEGKLHVPNQYFYAKLVPDEYSLVDYTVTFDISSLKDSVVALGKSWMEFDGTKSMDVGTNNSFPNLYVLTGNGSDNVLFNEAYWVESAKKESDFEEYSEWDNWYWSHVGTSMKPKFTPDLIENILGDEASTEMTLYPLPVDALSDNNAVRDAWAIWIGSDDTDHAESYHGSVVISQTWNGKTYSQESELVYAEVYLHQLLVPLADDTLVFDVSLKPDPGYAMELFANPGNDFGWSSDEGYGEDPPEGEGWGLNLDSDVMTLKLQPERMSRWYNRIAVAYTQLHYNMDFTMPSDAELFVANKLVNGDYVIDWFGSMSDITVDDVKAPVVYNAEGCRISWKVDESDRIESEPTASIQEELAYMTSNEKSEGFLNTLVPDVERSDYLCDGSENYFTQFLNVEGEGTIKLLQKLGNAPETEDDPAQTVITHSFSPNDGLNYYMHVPAAYNDNGNGDTVLTGVKFIVQVEPGEGYVLDRLTYETSKNGNYIIAELEDGDSLNIMENLVFNAKFVNLAPIYVTYDLSLSSAEDSANTYLPTSAVTAGSVELESNADTAAFWKPYRTDKCFAGWSTTSADRFTTGIDSIYQVLDADHFGDFSTNSDNPTKLFAIWQECTLPEPTVVLKNGSEHTTVTLYQMFGEDSLPHEITTEGISLVGDEFVFHMDESKSKAKIGYRIAEDAEYMFTYTVAGSDESVSADRDVDHDNWYVRTEGIEGVPTYAIDIATEAVEYNFVLKVEDNDVFYGSAYSSTWTPTADDFGKSLPGNIYRAGQKLSGWSFGTSTEAFQNFDDDFVNAYNDYVEEVTRHGELEGPVTLYAVWEENHETPKISMYLSSEAAEAGKLSLTQLVEEDTVEIEVSGSLEIPAVEGLAFAVNYTTDSAHSVAAAEKPITLMGDFGVVAQIDNGEMVTIDETYLNLSSIEVNVSPTIDEYEFVFDINVDEDAVVYYGTNWTSTATYSMAENGHRFPTSAYQQSNCLAGFYFEPMEPLPAGYTMTMPDVKFYTEIDSEFVADYKKLGRQLDTLYAVWYEPGEKCQQQLVMVGTSNTAAEGTFTLTNAGKAYTVPAAEEESVLGIPVADDLEFDVLFTAGDTYDDYGTNDISIKMGKITESHTNGDAYIFTRNAELVADPTLKMTEFELAFAENADGATLFYGENWFTGKIYDISDADASIEFPTSLYRTDKCLEGFAFEDSDPTVTYRELSEDFVTRFKAEDYSSPLTLYAVWGDCSEPRATYTITAANDTTEGKFVLTNSFGDDINNEYEFDNLSSLVVPAEEDLKFKVTFAENAAFDYTGKVDVYDAANTETALARVNDGESYIFTGTAQTQQLHAVVELKTKTFVLKVEDDHVFYPSDFAGFEWTPTSYGDMLPTNVYAVGFKLAGWQVGVISGTHTKFDNAFVEAYKQSLASSETPEESDTLYVAWDSDDETGTYTIYFDSDEAGSLTLKNGAADIENEFQIGGGLEVPAKENLVFSVNFVADNEHTIKNGRPVKLVDVNGTIIDSIANGGTFELTQTTHIAVETSEDVYHFAFNANAATGDTVFYGTDWFSEKEYDFTGDRNFYFPTSAYQTGKCLAGFAFDAAGTGDTFKELNEDFIVAYRAIEGEKPSTLYAVWTTPEMDSDCDPQVYTVKTNNTAAEGAFTLVNAGNSYSVSDEEIAVPYAADLAFTVQFTAGQAYHLSYEDKIRILDEYGEYHGSVSVGDEVQLYRNTILNAELNLNSTGLVLSANADAVFYGRDYNPDVMEGHDLPRELYRTNAVFMGWSFKKGFAEGEPVLTTWNDDFNRAYKKHVESRETFDTPDTLYALWTPSSNRETVTVSVENKASEGSVKLTNVSYGYSEEFFVAGESSIVIPMEDDLEFEVDFISESDKVDYTYINVVSPNGTINETFWMGQTRTFLEDARLKASGEIGSLELVLNVNAGDANVFYGGNFEFRWWGSSYGEELPKGIYRSDAKLVGWSFKKNATASEAYTAIDDIFIEEYETYKQNLDKVYEQRMKEFEAYMSSLSPAELAKLDQYAFEEYQMKFLEDVYPVLYAVWDTKATVPTHTLVSNSLKQGTLTIMQQVSDSTFAYVVGKDGLEIPTALDDEIIAMGHFEPNPSWLLMGKRPLVWASASGADTTENDFYGNLNEMPKSLTFSVIAKYIGFHLVFNVNSKDSLFFGDDWKSEGDFIATAEETMLPAMVYNSDRCLEGWSVKPDSKTSYTVMGDALADELYATYPNLDDTTKVNLYARFTDSLELCAGELTRIAIEQDKGSVMLVENTGSAEAVHKFNGKGTMLIPMDIVSLEWTVRSVPDSSYELGSVSITRNEKVMSILHEGEHLPGSLEGALLTAVFEKSNKTPIQIVDTSFVQSGNAIRLSFKASDFEVTRGVSARVQLIDMATDSVVIDSLLGDSVAMGYTDEVVLRAKRTGNYKVALVLEDSLEVGEYSREFTVVNEIASIAADSWQMLSLAAVDTSKIDTVDQIFYWWDEHGTGEFWQYKQFSVGDSVVATRGAWYNSLEGKPLVLRQNIEDDGKDIVWDLDSVSTGWNLVANTHGWAVDLYSNNPDKIKDVDEESEVSFWRYNAATGDYDSVLTMQPYEAVWAKVTKKMTWNISAKPVFKSENDTTDVDSTEVGDPANPVLLKRVLAKAATKERWTLQAVLADQNGKRDAWNIIGTGLNPFNDEEPPESMGDHVQLSIIEGKRAFAKSIKPFSDDMEWTVSISASTNRIGYLSLVGIDGVKAYGYRVYVTVDGNTTEMQEGVPLKVYLKESAKTATVRVAPANRVVAESSLKGLRMARLGGKLQVSFDATGLAGKSARVDILDMKGHVMATANARAVEGTNALLLDAPKSGLYMLRVRAGSQQQATKIMVK